jgi:hypothetical protein
MSTNNTLADYMARRKLSGHCIRCARPHDGRLKTCDTCRMKVKQAKEAKKDQSMIKQSITTISALCQRIERLELQVENLKRRIERGTKSAYQSGRNYGKNELRKKVSEAINTPRYRDAVDAIFGDLPDHVCLSDARSIYTTNQEQE